VQEGARSEDYGDSCAGGDGGRDEEGMPGRLLTMATNGAEGAKSVINGKQSLAGAVLPAEEVVIPGIGKRASETALINGDTHITGLGAYPTPNGVSPSSPTKTVLPDSMYDLPEEIMHITADRHSLGALIQRVSGECFNSLEELVDELSRIPIQLPPPLVNGASNIQHPPTLDQAQQRDNMRKKKKMLEFASEYRAKFIKLLVVTDWTKRDDKVVGKLIDLKNWLMEQDDAAPFAGNFFAATVMDLRSFKITNPDLETALAVLSGGDVPWIPHFGYRKQKTLTAGEVLKVLRQMNTIINMRLVLHEELIPQMRDYRVADGRATFTFPQEFELDVYVASGEPGKPWFFLDLRFLFEPAPQMTGAGIREVMDRQVNAALLRGGLREACDLVHNFTLTHKLGILRKQAQDLQRGVWAGALGVELVRRTLTVHYWVESPQSKSWIEIGIHTGKDRQRRKKVDNAISSQIRARWIRNHDEQKGVEVPINLGALSIERVLSAHIARHSSYILEKVRDALKEIGPNVGRLEENPLKLSLTTSDTEPADCSLRAQIGEHPATTLQIDGITGRMYFSPAGSASTNAQVALERSKDPISDAPGYFARYLTYEIQVRLDQLIENGNWDARPNINVSKEEVCRRTKQDVHRFAFFQSRGFGGVNWFLMYTIDLSGEQWWLFEM
jgi:mediator of RNA polymerase II transcription subunit 14